MGHPGWRQSRQRAQVSYARLSRNPGGVVYRPTYMGNEPNCLSAAQSGQPRPTPEAEEVYRRWIRFLDDEFLRHRSPERRAEIVRDQLYQLYLGRPHGNRPNVTLTSELPGNVLGMSLDPENVTLEAEHFGDIDPEAFAIRKPLLWFWKMFDRSPIGLNLWLGIRFRCMLGRHIFDHMGSGVKIYHGVDLTYGYKLSIDDGAMIHQGVLLHDRGGISIGKGVVVGSFARVFSHSYVDGNIDKVKLMPTKIGDGARIGSHTIVLGGQNVGAGEVVGSYPVFRA